MSYFWYSDMELQHLAQWKEYSKFSNDEKKLYFQDPIPHGKRQFKLVFKEHRFHAMNLLTKNCRRYSWGNVFSSCGQRTCKGRSTKHFLGKQWPVLQIYHQNPLQLRLVVNYLIIGVSFRMAVPSC